MKFQVFGFAIIVSAAIGGVDYSMQSKQTDQSLGLSGYIDTVTGRFDKANEARALKSRQKAEVKIHLPQAPEGWTRSDWDETDTTRLEPLTADLSGFQKRGLMAVELAPMMGGMVATEVQLGNKMRRTTIWVYERGDESIALRVIYTKTGAADRFPGLDAKIAKANDEGIKTANPYALVQGVKFGEVQLDRKLTGPVSYRAFAASMGSNVTIGVRAHASDETILQMMDAIDYDGLNGMLDVPIANVGKDALQVKPELLIAPVVQSIDDQSALTETAAKITEAAAPVEQVVEVDPVDNIIVGFKKVTGLPGQKCARNTGTSFCGVATE